MLLKMKSRGFHATMMEDDETPHCCAVECAREIGSDLRSLRSVLCAVVDVDASTYISTADADFNRDNKLWFPLPSFRVLFFPTLLLFFLLSLLYSFSFSFTLLVELTCSLTFNFIISKAFSHAELIELFTPEGTVVVRIKLHSWESERDRICVISASDAQWRWEVH